MRELKRMMIPDDDTGQVLRQMLDDGDDLDAPRDIAFLFVFADQSQAQSFATSAAAIEDLAVGEPERDLEGIWQVAATRHMPARHAAIVALEKQLAELAEANGGYPDGWECSGGDAD